MATINDLMQDMTLLSDALSSCAANPQLPFTSDNTNDLNSRTGAAVNAYQHLQIVASKGGAKTSSQVEIDQCDNNSKSIIRKLQTVNASKGTSLSETAQSLYGQAGIAIAGATAIY